MTGNASVVKLAGNRDTGNRQAACMSRGTEERMDFTHQAERKAFRIAIDGALKHVKKDREESFLQLIDLAEKFMGGCKFRKEDYERARELVRDPDG